VRLAQALGAVLAALRRELVSSDQLIVRERRATLDGKPAYEFLIGDEDTIAAIEADGSASQTMFDEWRGGVGLSLLNARRILNNHGGSVWAPPEGRKAGARIVLPSS
jgi:hypothetical protein